MYTSLFVFPFPEGKTTTYLSSLSGHSRR
jgi:hypothetical protein